MNGIWDLPDLATSGAGAGKKAVGYILNDWQISGVLTANSGTRYDITYTYQSNGASKNLTGSPDYGARIVYLGDPGSGCSDNQFAQFNAGAVTGPSYNSLGMESGRNLLANCADKTVDLSLSRSIRMGGSRQLQFRADVFNAFNVAIINDRQAQIQYDNPISKNVLNAQYNADGSVVASSPDTEERRFRRRHRRAEHAEYRATDPLPVLSADSGRHTTRIAITRDADHADGHEGRVGLTPPALSLVRLSDQKRRRP